jgi:hypothetical protein
MLGGGGNGATKSAADGSAATTTEVVRRSILALIIGVACFFATSVTSGFLCDDHFLEFGVRELPEIFSKRLNLFSIVTTRVQVDIFKRFGLLPWWTSHDLQINFFRPIPSITHWLDTTLVQHNACWAHLMSIGWYSLSIYLVWRVLARFIPETSWALPVAVAIFALDDAHAINVGWIANRNEIIGGVFVLLSVLAWLRLREGRGEYHALLVVLAFACALLSKESTVVLPLFILTHAACFPAPGEAQGRPNLWARIRPRASLHLVLLATAVAYVVTYFSLGFGANSVYYINPIHSPWVWLQQLPRSVCFHAVILVTNVPLTVLSSSPVRDFPLAAGLLGAATVAFAVLALRWLRDDRAFWMFVMWMAAGQLVQVTTFPDARNLFIATVGFAFVAARLIQEGWRRRHSSAPARYVMASLLLLHLVIAPLLDQACVEAMNRLRDSHQQLTGGLRAAIDYGSLERAGSPELQVFFLNWHQREMFAGSGLFLRTSLPTGVGDYTRWSLDPSLSRDEKLLHGLGAERIHYHALSLVQEVDAVQLGEHELSITPRSGRFFDSLFERLYTTDDRRRATETFDNGVFRAVLEDVSPAGDVRRVRFIFPEPLSSSRYRFLVFRGNDLVPWPSGSHASVPRRGS